MNDANFDPVAAFEKLTVSDRAAIKRLLNKDTRHALELFRDRAASVQQTPIRPERQKSALKYSPALAQRIKALLNAQASDLTPTARRALLEALSNQSPR